MRPKPRLQYLGSPFTLCRLSQGNRFGMMDQIPRNWRGETVRPCKILNVNRNRLQLIDSEKFSDGLNLQEIADAKSGVFLALAWLQVNQEQRLQIGIADDGIVGRWGPDEKIVFTGPRDATVRIWSDADDRFVEIPITDFSDISEQVRISILNGFRTLTPRGVC